MRLLMSVYRDGERRHPVRQNPEEARAIITHLLKVEPTHVESAGETHAPDDYWVDLPKRTVTGEPIWQYNDVLDISEANGGRIIGVPPEEDS